MNKEILVAIAIGIVVGLGGAIYFNGQTNLSTPDFDKTNILAEESVALSPAKETNKEIEFKSLPKNNSLVKSPRLKIQAKAGSISTLILATLNEITSLKIKKNEIQKEIDLKPGLNELVLGSYNKEELAGLKVLRFYYFVEADNSHLDLEDKKASNEAELLKQKLEKEVLKMRNQIKTVYHGKVVLITDKQLILDVDGKKQTIVLEPEITKVSQISGKKMTEISVTDVAKNNLVTAFISNIAGEEKCYTLYKEPAILLLSGKISNIDKTNYTVTIVNYDKSSLGADINEDTNQQIFDLKTGLFKKGGFSKLAIGDQIYALTASAKNGTNIITDYLTIPLSAKVPTATPSPTEKISPKATNKLTPKTTITKAP